MHFANDLLRVVLRISGSYARIIHIRMAMALVTWLILWQSAYAQTSAERSALTKLHKKKWEQARSKLQKSAHKDSSHVVTKYVYALYYSSEENPQYNIDSAHTYAAKARSDFNRSTSRQQERMKKLPLDSARLLKLEDRIDSLAFVKAKNGNNEDDYLYFLTHFPNTSYQSRATELRDEAAYMEALKENTYLGFLSFLQKYPSAVQSTEAQMRYDKLLYEEKTKDIRLTTYEDFLTKYPTSPYRIEAERNVFQISTAAGDDKVFKSFLNTYPNSTFAEQAKNILLHIEMENSQEYSSEYPNSNVARDNVKPNQDYLVPFLNSGKYGFMDNRGKELLGVEENEINSAYRCGNITDDILILSNRIITKDGKLLYEGELEGVDDLGFGFLKVHVINKIKIIHKSGYIFDHPQVEDGKLLNGKFIALKRNKLWSVWTLTGKQLLDFEWDEVSTIKDVVVLKKQNKFKLVTPHQLALLADQRMLKTQDFFDMVKAFPGNLIWARTGEYEGIMDQSLNNKVPFEKHLLEPGLTGIISTSSYGKKIYNAVGNMSGIFENIKVNELWTAIKITDSWLLFDPKSHTYLSEPFDSVNFIGPFAVGYFADTLSLYFSPTHAQQFLTTQLQFIPGKDSTSYIILDDRDKKALYNNQGENLFVVSYDKINYAGDDIFIITKKDKKGLINGDGKVLLPLEYDAISSVSNKVISVLKNKKFGLFHIITKKFITPDFDKNLTVYNKDLSIAYKDGFYGLVGWHNKHLSNFEFNEVIYWNDTTALVKKNTSWQFYFIAGKRVIEDNIKSFSFVADTNGERIAVIHKDNKFGVVSNRKGTILPTDFNTVNNLGSSEEPFYFTETHNEDDDSYAVIYYNKEGRLIRKQKCNEDEYDQIYCPD